MGCSVDTFKISFFALIVGGNLMLPFGLALGSDTLGHSAAIKFGGRTIAVCVAQYKF